MQLRQQLAFVDGSIEVLLIDDADSGETVRQELEIWRSKLSAEALVLLHGASLERQDSPGTAWLDFVVEKAAAHFGDGIGLSVATEQAAAKASPFRTALFDETTALAQGYRLIAESIRTREQTRRVEHRARFFEARQTVFDTIVEDRTKAQSVIESQERSLTDFNRKFDAINADRVKAEELLGEPVGSIAALAKRYSILSIDRAEAQLVMNDQFAQIQKMHAKMTEQKRVLAVAKATCRNKGRCFVVPKEPKPQRSLKERVAREFARIPRNLRRIFFTPPTAPQKKIALKPVEKNYAEWVAEHEPTADDLEKQRRESRAWDHGPKISLLIPLFDTPAEFLNQLFASVVAQTYENWEACVVDGGSKNREMLDSLQRWIKADARVRVQRLDENLGISENTNHALLVATGDFVALVDHDDVLAPFALYELASAIRRRPGRPTFFIATKIVCANQGNGRDHSLNRNGALNCSTRSCISAI